ncbi:ATP-dependent zinc metalloprotease FTSH 12 [Colletotrichum gloeosporioides]|uniref:ATP-dependent zinc metalloprotease FTSH 12 n=1 Tax=Colletotrichum gloeosporioides TaxID=474922 RepID=A0A8H4CBE1_COLGL|nr:ATP-dependent zinc metalloprotease FTSH 12 [Colletotrichum gloeosporioides]KAF3800722.1 ATP-dependent zinc metalloprotease FTSH 12 [Colletotrichum gloeosporioides]
MTSNDGEETPTVRSPWRRQEEPMEETMPSDAEREGLPATSSEAPREDEVSDADEVVEEEAEDTSWLLDNCVTTTDEWNDHPEFLRLLDVIPSNKGDNCRDELETASNPEPAAEVYEMGSTLFNPLLGLVRRDVSSEEDLLPGSYASNDVRFTKDIIRLHTFMSAASESTANFTRNVVKHFARTIDSDLITLTRDDLEDLGDHYAPPDASDASSTTSDSSSDSDDDDMGNYLDILLNREPWQPPPPPLPLPYGCPRPTPVVINVSEEGVAPHDGYDSEAEESKKKKFIPFAAVLNAPRIKKSSASRPVPLIVHLFISEGDLTRSLFRDLQAAIRDYPVRQGLLLIVTTESPSHSPTYVVGHHRGPPGRLPLPFTTPTEVLPVRSAAQEALLKADGKRELLSRNIRDIKRYIRREENPGYSSSLLAPYADWSFIDGSTMAERMSQASLVEMRLESISRAIGQPVEDDNIRKVVLDYGVLSKTLKAWNDFGAPLPPRAPMPMPKPPRGMRPPVRAGAPPPPPPPFPAPPRALDPRIVVEPLQDLDDEWAKFPPAVQKVMRQITYLQGPPFLCSKYSWERKFSHCLISPKDVEVSWDDIALEPAVEDAIRGIIRQHGEAADSEKSYGLLHRSYVGGTLLYGPAGTGKTHFARVLARESGSTVISVSLADISDIDSEPRLLIRGLFSLGTLLAPSILFFDEADLCLGAREKAVNHLAKVQISQILTEMNGLGAAKNLPLVLLATNAPAELDPAVLRRIPNRIHMGLPSAEMRAEIFEIALRGEILHPDLDGDLLALLTPRFSGADIHHLCVQATMMCDTFVEDGANKGKRLLTQALFEKVLKRVRPSVSKASLSGIRKFAMEYDPAAVETMEPLETEEYMELEDLFVDVPVFK